MRKIYYGIGGGISVLGLWSVFVTASSGRGLGGIGGAAVFVVVGVLLLIAAIRNFRGHWPLPVGLAMVASPLVLAAFFFHDSRLIGAHKDAILVVGAAAVIGLGLLNTAVRFNRMSRRIEELERKPIQSAQPPRPTGG
jgi:peptidoglycan/LPS O-acetylase OafA/YrhL